MTARQVATYLNVNEAVGAAVACRQDRAKREGKPTASRRSLSRQARNAAKARTSKERSQAARKAARTRATRRRKRRF